MPCGKETEHAFYVVMMMCQINKTWSKASGICKHSKIYVVISTKSEENGEAKQSVCVSYPRLVVLGMPIFILIESSFSNTIVPHSLFNCAFIVKVWRNRTQNKYHFCYFNSNAEYKFKKYCCIQYIHCS